MLDRIRNCLRNGQKGAMIVVTALGIGALMFGSALAVDLGGYYVQASNLQNAADSAALAGASVYVENGETKLVPITDFAESGNTLTATIDGTKYTFTKYTTDTAAADTRAKYYVKSNTGERLALPTNGTTTTWKAPVNATMVDKNKASYTDAYCYRVDLEDTLDLYFTRVFGIDSWPIKVSALALIMPTEETKPDDSNIDDFIKTVNANIYKTVPNYYWETILHKEDSFNVASSETTDELNGYGNKSIEYFTTDFATYVTDAKIATTEDLGGGTGITKTLAYATSTVSSGTGKYCATPITGTDNVGLKQLVYTLNEKIISGYTNGTDITGLFLDRPNTHSDFRYRATVFNINSDHLSDDTDKPLYVRFESEPIKVGNNITFVQPITVNVTGWQEKPIVIAYDGPDPNRSQAEAPAVYKSNGSVPNVGGPRLSEVQSDGVTVVYYDYSSGKIPTGENLTNTSTWTSAPYTVNLNADFNGVIYAPYSRVIINGTGKITGFIMAAEIIDYGKTSTRTTLTSKTIKLPTWGAKYQSGKTDRFDYTVRYNESQYTVVYDNFYNYTID